MAAAEDIRRLTEARHDLEAARDPKAITTAEPLQNAIAYTRDEYAAADERLRTVLRTQGKESAEARAARATQAGAGIALDDAYRFVRNKISDHLLNLSPAQRAALKPGTLEARHATFLRMLPHAPADLARVAAEKKVEIARDALAALGDEAGLIGEAELARARVELAPATDALDAANQGVAAEGRDGKAVQDALVEARADFDRTQTAHLRQIEAALEDAGRSDHVGRYIRARDPAYRARRLAGTSIRGEEGVEAVTRELGTTPDAIEEPG